MARKLIFGLILGLIKPPLKDLVSAPLEQSKFGHKIRDYWQDCEGWFLQDFENLLPSSTLLRIAIVTLRNEEMHDDYLGWRGMPSGDFLVRSAHGLEAGWGNKQVGKAGGKSGCYTFKKEPRSLFG